MGSFVRNIIKGNKDLKKRRKTKVIRPDTENMIPKTNLIVFRFMMFAFCARNATTFQTNVPLRCALYACSVVIGVVNVPRMVGFAYAVVVDASVINVHIVLSSLVHCLIYQIAAA